MTAAKSGATDVALTFSGGTGPYAATSANTPDFSSGSATLAQSTAGPGLTDRDAQLKTKNIFYNVTDASNPPVNSGNYSPPPPILPVITALSATSATDNETITITATAGLSAYAAENLVWFDGEPAHADTVSVTDGANGGGTLTVRVPVGATSGFVRLQVGALVSNRLSLTIIVNDPAAPFAWVNLRSLAFGLSSEGILASDGAGTGGNQIYTLQWNGATMKWVRAVNGPQIGAVLSHRDANGFFYIGSTNSQLVSRTTFAGPQATFVTKCSNSAASNGSVPLIGARDTDTDTAYCGFIDTSTSLLPNHVAKRLLTTGSIFDYGNLGSAGFVWPSQGNIVFDKAGNLFLTERTQIRKITPAQVVSVVKSGFNNLLGLDWIGKDAADPGYLVAVDRGVNKLFLIDLAQSPAAMEEIVPEAGAFNTPAAVIFAQAPGSGNSVLYVAENPTTASQKRILRLRNPIFERVNGDAPLRLLISKQETADTYPEPDWQSADAVFRVAFKIHPPPPAGKRACFRVIDPADTSPYPSLPAQAGCAGGTPPGQVCDNGDQSYDLQTIFAPVTTGKTVCTTTPDATGRVDINVRMAPANASARFGGDNYRVQAGFDDFGTTPSALVWGVSPYVTAWKRHYIIRSTMFRSGGLLAQDFPDSTATCADNQIVLTTSYQNLCATFPCTIPVNTNIVVFDQAHPYRSGTDQQRIILSVTQPATGCGSGNVLVTLATPLDRNIGTYSAGVTSTTQKSAGIGVVSASSGSVGLFPYSIPLQRSFSHGFEEDIPSGPLIVTPYAAPTLFGACDSTSNIPKDNWRTIWARTLLTTFNHYFFAHIDQGTDTGVSACTEIGNKFSRFYVTALHFATSCPSLPCPVQEAQRMQFSETHEKGHDDDVNDAVATGCSGGAGGTGHDLRCDWTNPSADCSVFTNTATYYCVMNIGTQTSQTQSDLARQNSNKFFDASDLLYGCSGLPGTANPQTSIRRRPDPQ